MVETLLGILGTLVAGFIAWVISKLAKKGKQIAIDTPETVSLLLIEIKGIKAQLVDMDSKREKAISRTANNSVVVHTTLDRITDAVVETGKAVQLGKCNGGLTNALDSLKEDKEERARFLTENAMGVA